MSTNPIWYKGLARIRAFAGVAKPNPKMGQALGPLGINMMQFCKEFNARTSAIRSDVPLRIIVYSFTDRSYQMKIKPPDTTWFLRKATGQQKFSRFPGRILPVEVPYSYVVQIAKMKQELDEDMRHLELHTIIQVVLGQCQSCGIYPVDSDMKPVPFAPKVKI